MATNIALDTTMGSMVLELYNDHAPKTCNNFASLAQRGYYNNVIFHRIIPNFMLQTGDPTGTGRGGSSIYGDKFEDEIDPSLKHTGAGVLSMANGGPNTNGSQFFITLAPTPWLDGKHTIFGRVKSGLRVVQRMGLVKTGAEDRPVDQVKILKARVLEEGDEALLVRDFNKYGLQDQAWILESLVEFHEFPYNQDFPKDMSRILEDFHQSLSEPMKGSLLEQIKLLEKVMFVRYRFLGEAHWSSVRAQASKLTEILNIRRNEVLEELRHHQSETMEENIILLDALSELDTHMYCNNLEGRDRLVSVSGLLWDQFKTGFLTQDQDDKGASTDIKTDSSACGPPPPQLQMGSLAAKIKPKSTLPVGPTIPANSPATASNSPNPVANLFEERRLHYEAREKKEFDDEAIAHRTRARARQEALMSDPAKAEQLKHAKKVKAAKVEDQRAKDNVKKTIQDSRVHMKTKAEQERLARKAVEEQGRLAKEARVKDSATGEGNHGDDSDEEGDLKEWQGRGAGRKLGS
ncbi:MAG: hypothetical protein Q9203_007272 [Teloschistes exilis]